MKTFIDWLELQEVGTGTSSVAIFARNILSGPVKRLWPWTEEDPFFKKKKSFREWLKDKKY